MKKIILDLINKIKKMNIEYFFDYTIKPNYHLGIDICHDKIIFFQKNSTTDENNFSYLGIDKILSDTILIDHVFKSLNEIYNLYDPSHCSISFKIEQDLMDKIINIAKKYEMTANQFIVCCVAHNDLLLNDINYKV